MTLPDTSELLGWYHVLFGERESMRLIGPDPTRYRYIERLVVRKWGRYPTSLEHVVGRPKLQYNA